MERDAHICRFSLRSKTNMAKPNKSILKRIRLTKRGKLIRRVPGQNHYNAKESRRSQRRKRALVGVPAAFRKQILARM